MKSQNTFVDTSMSTRNIEYLKDTLNINALYSLQKEFSQSLESNDGKLAELSIALGDYFFEYGLYQEAIRYYKYNFSSHKDASEPSRNNLLVYRKMGQCYSELGMTDSSFFYYETLIDAFEYPENLEVYREIVEMYTQAGIFGKSLDYNLIIEEVLLDKKAPSSDLIKVYNNIGYSYHRMKEYELSIEYFKKSLELIPEAQTYDRGLIQQNLGVSYFNLGDLDRSLKYLYAASKLYESQEDLSYLYHLIASIHISNNDYFYALNYLELADESRIGMDDPYLEAEILSSYSKVHNATHEYDLAFQYFEAYSRLSDSLKFVNQLNQKRIIDNQKFIERAEKENRLLKAKQDFQKLKISQLETESKNQALRTDALRADSIQRENILALAIKENEISKAKETNNILEIERQKDLIRLRTQQLDLARAAEANAIIEQEKQQKDFEIAQQTIDLQKQEALLNKEKADNVQQAKEIEISKIRQRNAGIVAAFMAGFALLLIWAYRIKRRDNQRISKAFKNLSEAQTRLKSAEEKIKGLLKQQVSGAVAEALISNTDPAKVEERFVCVMFIDIRNFTVFCEGKDPADIIAYQNSVFGFMIDLIEKHGGVVNQLLGDGFMATFGAPLSRGNDCLNAYNAANEILKVLKVKVAAKEVIPTKVGIGLHAGNVVTGNVGNDERRQYSITGNTVILAARLEQLNKQYGSSLIYSKEVYETLPMEVKTDISFENVIVKGRSKPIEIAVVM
ncbi:MAG: adenylate/guanylate cyclase domain-containing protein [Saprospiraceae bacterium]|nr:adenylate/guanylate cyclase domain-containing protein [Saprospiraceae bacterium]